LSLSIGCNYADSLNIGIVHRCATRILGGGEPENEKILVCPHGQGKGVEPVRTGGGTIL